jgi:uncharacterized protein YjbI with pentapeptide repeats
MKVDHGARPASGSPHPKLKPELERILKDQEEWTAKSPRQGPAPARPDRLTSFNLRGLDLSSRTLREIDFRGLDLSGTNFRAADLRGASLRLATLVQCDFEQAELHGAVFFDADLRRSKLRSAHSLSADALGGADLTSAELPDDVKEFAGLAAVADVASYIQTLFKMTLVLTMFVAITMASTRDPELLNTNGTGSMKLPFLDAPMPTFWFNWIGPFLLVVIHIYTLTYVKNLFSLLCFLPAVFPDGGTLDKRAYPSMNNTLIRYHFPRLPDDRTWAGVVHRWLALLMTLWLVPVALSSVWLRCLSAHDWNLTSVQIGMLSVSVFAGLWIYAIMLTALARGSAPRPTLRARWEQLAVRRVFFVGATLAVTTAAVLFSFGAFNGANPQTVKLVYGENVSKEGADRWYRTIVPGCFSFLNHMSRFTHLPFADFEGLDVSERTATTPRHDLSLKDLDAVHGAWLEGADLRFCKAFDAFFVHAKLYAADLREADLRQANLQRADLRAANLQHAVLRDADLREVEAYGADFTHAYMVGAKLSAALLYPLDPKKLYREDNPPRSGPTTFHLADLTKADLSRADLTQVDFRGADLTAAKFRRAILEGADFRAGASDEENGRQAMIRTVLAKADFRDAKMQNADFRGVDLHEAVGLKQEQIDLALGDEKTKLPSGLDAAKMIQNGRVKK